MSLAAHGFADHRKCVLPDLAVRRDVVGGVEIALIDLLARDERVDFDGVLTLDRKGVEFVVIYGNVGVLGVFVAPSLIVTLDRLSRDLVNQLLA